MKKTDNYQLSQWDPTDRILREDFNADNLNVEKALAGLAAGKLGRPELFNDPSEDNTAAGGFFMNTDWKNWEFAAIYFDLLDPPDPEKTIKCEIDDDGPCFEIGKYPFLLLFHPEHDPDKRVTALLLSEPLTRLVHLNLTYREFIMIFLSLGGGARFKLHFYGVR